MKNHILLHFPYLSHDEINSRRKDKSLIAHCLLKEFSEEENDWKWDFTGRSKIILKRAFLLGLVVMMAVRDIILRAYL